jgi:hypothetical protein
MTPRKERARARRTESVPLATGRTFATGTTHEFILRRLVRLRLVDMCGDPMPEADAEVIQGEQKQSKASDGAGVLSFRATERFKLKTKHGRRFLFGDYEYYRAGVSDEVSALPDDGAHVLEKVPYHEGDQGDADEGESP